MKIITEKTKNGGNNYCISGVFLHAVTTAIATLNDRKDTINQEVLDSPGNPTCEMKVK